MTSPIDSSEEIAYEPRLLLDGELREATGGATYENRNPATEEVVGLAADAQPADVELALAAARRAFDETDWSTNLDLRLTCLRQMHEALLEHVDELTEISIAEVGATRMACSTIQVVEPLKFLPYYIDLAEKYQWRTDLGSADTLAGPADRWTEAEAIGVVAAITPWNVPTQINLAKIVPALAAGCTVILKAAPDTPWSALALGHVIAEHCDFPPGVINIISSSDNAIGELLTTDPRVDMISFTGSTATGRRIMAAASDNITKVFLELGGKSAMVILDDVEDFGMAAATAAFGTATVCGQGCALSTRVLLPRSKYDEGVAAIAAMMAATPPGDPSEGATMLGPLINEAQRDRVEGYVQSAIDEGARVVCGGKRPADQPVGYFYEPTLIADVTPEMTVAKEEIFGPVLVALGYDDSGGQQSGDDEAVRIANDSIFGLSGHVFGADEDRAMAVARRIRTGTMSINGGVWYGADVPFGGYKQSGIGREMGVAGFEEYLETKAYARPGS